MNCIIIDDEPLAINIIKSYCEDIGELEVIKTFTNPLESIGHIQTEEVDLVFLDIEMPQITGIEFVKSIDKKPLFIFTTAYPQYAIDGFELNAVDYLVKPVPFPRFVTAINRVKELLSLRQGHEKLGNVSSASGSESESNQFIFVKSDYGNVKIKLENITHIQGLKDYLKIHIDTEKKPILTLMNFKDIEVKLSSNDFIRVHRSFVVNVNKIDSIQKSKIVIYDIRIPIGDSYREAFMKRVGL
ncbi:LytR/AlgR family response regulator transcription factor [Croceitalea rosinachiae]|uniref:Response regulator transcription factor n=1 Tax=Croceitalea rosinachiae TaxID=3075596 RepID=A0ABU3ACH9_9FLAO|nr:response regulator transcription factor [Croceitalea sp. F388]MDT0606808.1 response regulator transcription factor [Croceitalea sp. F388]